MDVYQSIKAILQIMLFVFLLSGIPAGALGALALWRMHRHPDLVGDNLIKYKGILLTAITIDMVMLVIASVNDTPHLHHNAWFWYWYLPGQTMVTVALWVLDACLFGLIKRRRSLE